MINKYIYVNSTSCGSITQRERRFNKKIAQHSRNTLETFFLLLNFCIVMPLVTVSKNKTFYKEFRQYYRIYDGNLCGVTVLTLNQIIKATGCMYVYVYFTTSETQVVSRIVFFVNLFFLFAMIRTVCDGQKYVLVV